MANLNTLSQLLIKLNAAVAEATQHRDDCIERGDVLHLVVAQELLDARSSALDHVWTLHNAAVPAAA